MKKPKNYDPKKVGETLFKFFNILKECIIEQEGKVGWVVNCTNSRLFYELNNKKILHKQRSGQKNFTKKKV